MRIRTARVDDLPRLVEIERAAGESFRALGMDLVGRALIEEAASWAVARGLRALTVTTYVDVPWNGPYYERLGFRYLDPAEETPELRERRACERADGLDAWPRASMLRMLGQNR